MSPRKLKAVVKVIFEFFMFYALFAISQAATELSIALD